MNYSKYCCEMKYSYNTRKRICMLDMKKDLFFYLLIINIVLFMYFFIYSSVYFTYFSFKELLYKKKKVY